MAFRATIVAVTAALGIAGAWTHGVSARPALAPAENVWLDTHNDARADFGVAPLDWSPELAREARRWAQQLAREARIRHSTREERGDTGENLWMGTAGMFRPEQMIGHFVDERRHFRPGEFPQVSRTGTWSDVGHYTQIVWADTREVGCASARGARFDVLVCRYWPAGNVIGERIAPQPRIAGR